MKQFKKILNKIYIILWLEKQNIKNYTITSNEEYGFVVDVQSFVNLRDRKLARLPVKFGHVNGSFNCSYNRLTSLKNCPDSVDGNFNCAGNQLTSLEYAPQSVTTSFSCDENQLTTLENYPKSMGGSMTCSKNKLVNLDDIPEGVQKIVCDYKQIYDMGLGEDWWKPETKSSEYPTDFDLSKLRERATILREKAILSTIPVMKKSSVNKL